MEKRLHPKFDGLIALTPVDLGSTNSISSPNLNATLKAEKISSLSPLPKTSVAQSCNTVTYVYSIPYNCASGSHGPGDSGCALQGSDRAGYANISNTVTTCYDVYLPTGGGDGGGSSGGGVTTPTTPPNYNPCPKAVPMIDFHGVKGERLAVAAGTPPCDLAPLPPAPNIAPIIIPLEMRLQYPVLGKIVDGLYEKVKNDPKLMAALKKFTHMKEADILANLKSGQGPKLVVERNLNRAGGFDKISNRIYISEHVVTASNFLYKDYSTAIEFYITVSILHEFIHFGENYTETFLPHEGNYDDAGYQFENNIYGGRVRFDYPTGNITYEKL